MAATVSVASSSTAGFVGGQVRARRRSVKMMMMMMCATNFRMRIVSPCTSSTFSGLRRVNAIDLAAAKPSSRSHHECFFSFGLMQNGKKGSRRSSRSCVPKACIHDMMGEKALRVLMLAQEESRRIGHNFVGTEQILLGLIGEGTGIPFQVLTRSLGITLKEARLEVETVIGRGIGFIAVEIPFTPRAKRLLQLALVESRQLGQDFIGAEHLLLALVREGEGVGITVLENLGVQPLNVRLKVLRMLDEDKTI